MILRKKCLSLFLSLSLVLPNLAPIYSYAEEATSINREEQKIKSENRKKEKEMKNQREEALKLSSKAGSMKPQIDEIINAIDRLMETM